MITDTDLIERHVQALYTNTGDRLLRVNYQYGLQAARFFLGKTSQGNIWRFRHDVPDRTVERLRGLCLDEPRNLMPELRHREDYLQILAEDRPIEHVHSEPAFVFEGGPAFVFEHQPADAGTSVISVTRDNREVLTGGQLEHWIDDVEHCRPVYALMIGSQAVSVCASVRVTDTTHECGVETSAKYRGRGLALQACRAWADAMFAANILPLYSTWWENKASRRLAAKLELRQYGATFHVS